MVNTIFEFWSSFVFLYPLLMAIVWLAGSVLYYVRREGKKSREIPDIDWPLISILVPCYNEEDTIIETVENLLKLDYPKKEIICINDGSKDNTSQLIHDLAKQYDIVRTIDNKENKGKANALRLALFASKGEYLLCVDSDAILDNDAPYHLVKHFFLKGERVGAVTGNPRIRNRDTMLARMQVVEYASIIGAIKRTQRIIGKIMTVSGVIVCFRKKALVDVGLWDVDMITEDISVSWKLHERFWDIRYEPNALCWMLVPEKLNGFWKQRVRWAQGGQEVIMRHWKVILNWKYRRLWPIYYEQWISIIWSYSLLFITLYYFIFTVDTWEGLFLLLTFSAFSLTVLSVIQLTISLLIDSRYDNVTKSYFWIIWYPFAFWFINALVAIFALPKAIKSRMNGGYAVWSSPDRGNRETK
ncbi:poly-beta-1,6 N-acetyl-D-glucosamine synthase [Macrococcoides bohemicum]|uniref:Poly-beta-1,6-N-acetyl-D-glucosamine synthase n=1 Tax=Macrococcoides bohemicum TaxID=1903056 RepID=A0AAJ4PAV2_9STAP|nr:poly-beta-1,6-N-acetyl-D-glucosamine synthase [Macrococcus bohemicus]QYA42199.1 poly-beta-1,6 N-acetyl-D-glucosamine synthase [Macrococcus bohemicus]